MNPAAPFVWYNPKTWSAPAQSIALVLIPILIALANKQFGWNIDPDTITKLFWGGVSAAGARAIIDHGETGPNDPGVPTVPPTPLTPAEIAERDRLNAKFKGLGLVLVIGCVLALGGCATGIGRAASLAVSGVPPTVAAALDSMEAEYDLRAAYEMQDIVGGIATTPEGILLQAQMQTRLQSRMDDEHAGFVFVRQYIGVEKGAVPTASADAAEKKRTEILDAVLARIERAKLVEAAKAQKAAPAETGK